MLSEGVRIPSGAGEKMRQRDREHDKSTAAADFDVEQTAVRRRRCLRGRRREIGSSMGLVVQVSQAETALGFGLFDFSQA